MLAILAERDAAVLRAAKLESELLEARQSTCGEGANQRATILERELEDALSKQSDCDERPTESATPEVNRLLDRIRDEQTLRHESETKLASCTQQHQVTDVATLPGPAHEISEKIYRPDATLCFPSFPKRPEQKKWPRPTAFMTKGWGLTSFSVSFWVKVTGTCTPRGKDSYPFWNQHWYDGCAIVTAAPGNVPPGRWSLGARRYRRVRSRNDWGITVDRMGHIMFGHGHRAPLYRTLWWRRILVNLIPRHAEWRNSTYRGEDFTLHSATAVDDGNWHFVVAERNVSNLFLYIDGAQQGCPSANLPDGALAGTCFGVPHSAPLDDAHYRMAVGWGFDGCVRDMEVREGGERSQWMGPEAVRRRMATSASPGQGHPKIPLYYYYFNVSPTK